MFSKLLLISILTVNVFAADECGDLADATSDEGRQDIYDCSTQNYSSDVLSKQPPEWRIKTMEFMGSFYFQLIFPNFKLLVDTVSTKLDAESPPCDHISDAVNVVLTGASVALRISNLIRFTQMQINLYKSMANLSKALQNGDDTYKHHDNEWDGSSTKNKTANYDAFYDLLMLEENINRKKADIDIAADVIDTVGSSQVLFLTAAEMLSPKVLSPCIKKTL